MSHKSRPPLTDHITIPRTYRKRRSTEMNPKMAVSNASGASRQQNWRQFPFAVGASFRIELRHEFSTIQKRIQNSAGPKTHATNLPKDKSPNPTAFSCHECVSLESKNGEEKQYPKGIGAGYLSNLVSTRHGRPAQCPTYGKEMKLGTKATATSPILIRPRGPYPEFHPGRHPSSGTSFLIH